MVKAKTKKKYRLLILAAALVVLLAAADIALTRWAPVERSTRFRYNDYEAELMQAGGTAFERVIFGGEALASAYPAGEAGFAVFDLTGGTVEDLAEMLRRGYLLPGVELSVYLSPDMLLSGEGDATYPWYRSRLEPYLWFQRARIWEYASGLLTKTATRHWPGADAEYYGMLTEAELSAAVPFPGKYGAGDLEDGLAALETAASWCAGHGVCFRVIAAPTAPATDLPDGADAAIDKALALCAELGCGTLDLRGRFPAKCFYDATHPNREYGAILVSAALDDWLAE